LFISEKEKKNFRIFELFNDVVRYSVEIDHASECIQIEQEVIKINSEIQRLWIIPPDVSIE
jgi:uncharacterized Fe-S cluster protein YjdI